MAIHKGDVSERAINQIPTSGLARFFVTATRKTKPTNPKKIGDWEKAQIEVAKGSRERTIPRQDFQYEMEKRMGITHVPAKEPPEEEIICSRLKSLMAKSVIMAALSFKNALEKMQGVKITKADKVFLKKFLEEKIIAGLNLFIREVLEK